ncbi:ABC transporter ATP-binding protein [Mucilaginibacter myungsuensis]|uniref:ABC transporter ATP-binding protein n=1 Tax=Mucilaginibacter myungsuensis TaxID=649104 RepID=A0A929KY15_9SPHI|nr:ABC transporter ATP-binding protein [Mucilaginibacter myungsuensis]MBE9660989.1 ABC transporter ATP-binding protein [Mucilaginibacter myungsuensis]MDN3601035.1 ABC transporter ATP-binding protein [Mucilaginibacter myungsuensis]
MINLNHINFRYSSKESVLEDLTLSLAPGHIYGLLGRNGVGKTSLMYILSGLRFPNDGQCSVIGFTPQQRKVDFLQQVYFLPDEIYFPPGAIDKYLALYTPFYPGFNSVMFYDLLAEFDIRADVHPAKLSLGQRKQIAICFALALRAKVLLLDEPTNALDIPAKKIFRKIIAGGLQEDQIIMISTHQVKDLESLIDHVLILDGQKMIIDRSIDELTNRIAFKYAADLEDIPNVIYSERALRGYATLSANLKGEYTKFDMELFFNAVLDQKQKVLSVLEVK